MYIILILCTLLLVLFILRALFYIANLNNNTNTFGSEVKRLKTIICMGSGGHTAEMLRILDKMNTSCYSPRLYVIANSDKTSETKVNSFENEGLIDNPDTDYSIVKISRSRQVSQSYISSVWTTLFSIMTSIPMVFKYKPDLIICNGPGTCIPICLIAFIMNLLYMSNCKIVFIESICRVRTLSLTGKILLYIANVFVVQWKQLLCYSRAKYFGRLT